jgi:hypothetical protein
LVRRRTVATVILSVVLFLSGATGYSQTKETEGGWTSLSFLGGLSTGASDTGVALGGTFIFELSPRLALEAAGQYMDRGSGADAFDLSGNLLISLVPSSRELVPYVTAGGGLYRASYDLDHERFLGPMLSRLGAGTNLWPGMRPGMMGPRYGPFYDPFDGTSDFDFEDFFGELPYYYLNRLGNMAIPANGLLGTRTFTDPAANFGGGVRFDVGPHVFLRPDARVLIAFADGDTYSIGLFTINVGYRF